MAHHKVSMILPARPWWVALMALVIIISGCDRQSDQPLEDKTTSIASAPHATTQTLQQVTTHAWQQGGKIVHTVEPTLLALQRAVQTLTSAPSELNLTNAQEQWHLAHQQLLQLQPFFTLGHINPGLFKQLELAQWQLDASPIEPGYLDYFDVYQHSGIVNDIALPITAKAIRQQHGFSSDHDVAIGMHAIAYLLWGEHQQRPASDFASQAPSAIEQQNGLTGADLPSRRRAALLNLLLSLMLDDLQALGYKLNHSASGLNLNYAKLPAQAQLQLWQQSINHLLRQLLSDSTMTLRRNTPPDNRFYPHQPFAGRQAQSVVATLAGVESLVTQAAVQGQTLAQAMNPELDMASLRQNFSATRELVLELEAKGEALNAEQVTALQHRLNSLAEQLTQTQSAPTDHKVSANTIH